MKKIKRSFWSNTSLKRSQGKYEPHQGDQEKARRRKRMAIKKEKDGKL